MKFQSTRGGDCVDLADALARGLAPDGGLYVPSKAAPVELSSVKDCTDIVATAKVYLAPFFDSSVLADALPEICAETFGFPIPLVALPNDGEAPLSVLELFHGPTAAFKDVGARFLAAALSRLEQLDRLGQSDSPLLILVATSGDTGGAVAAAFHGRSGFKVAVLYPQGRVSARQQHQLTCWGDNVSAFCVDGNFDDCQRLVKAAFADTTLNQEFRLSSANSINIGRLLPQSVYYAHAALEHYAEHGAHLNLIVPTGNLGNGLAAILARARGLPIGDIVLATNANKTIPDFLASGRYEARDSIATLASAMDVGNPSNMERLRHLFGEADALNSLVEARAYDDERIQQSIVSVNERFGMAVCPHTATGFAAYDDLPPNRRAEPWAVVATAHPAKFNDIVEPLVEAELSVPRALADLLERPSKYQRIAPELAALREQLRAIER